MKKYMTAQDKAEEAATVRIANMVVQTAGLELDAKIPILPPEFAQFLIAPHAQLLIVPSTVANGNGQRKVEYAMRMAQCDAVMVHIVPGGNGSQSVMFTIARGGRVPAWFPEYSSRVLDRALYFMPVVDQVRPLFKLTNKGLMMSSGLDGMHFDGY